MQQRIRSAVRRCPPGGVIPGGYITHFFEPRTTPFQAWVELGSMCQVLPDLKGPAAHATCPAG